jgi:4-hydroxybenzoyl-CoA thioesterase
VRRHPISVRADFFATTMKRQLRRLLHRPYVAVLLPPLSRVRMWDYAPRRTTQDGRALMLEEQFTPPTGAFTRSVPIRFSHCDPAGIVYFPHYFDMFNGVIEDWYKDELKHDYAALVMGERFGFPFVHIECDFKIPSLMGDVIELTLLVDRIGRSSLGIVIVCHRDGLLRLRARMVTAMMSLETRKPVPLPQALRAAIEAYRARTGGMG